MVDIIIPTYNNLDQLSQFLHSVSVKRRTQDCRVILVNNGAKHQLDDFKEHSWIKIINTGENLGWEGGLIEGLKHSESEFVLFANDDILVPPSHNRWLSDLLQPFRDPKVGAVGPSSNVVMGIQNIWYMHEAPVDDEEYQVPYLIGFCMMVRRKALDVVGGIDDSLPGGDDLDLSIRLQVGGWKLIAKKNVFIYHHGFQTGHQVHGTPDQENGWNSHKKIKETNIGLIKKHGFAVWFDTIYGKFIPSFISGEDIEGKYIRSVVGGGEILELGVGGQKTVKESLGMDIVKKGDLIPNLKDTKSVADIEGDATKKLPFEDGAFDWIIARHLLEHCIDVMGVLREWKSKLKKGGRMVVAVPNEEYMGTIPLNPEHVHAFTPGSLANIFNTLGFEEVKVKALDNAVSFVITAQV